jgi:hypothetical protein
MASGRKWHVWSIDRENLRGLVVNEGVTEKEATADAEHRNATAQRLNMASTAFIALPDGQQPSEADLPPLPEKPAARNEHPLHSRTAAPGEHEYFVEVGTVRGEDPQAIRSMAIDCAVNDVPDIDARYEVVPGYTIGLTPASVEDLAARGAGRLTAWSVRVRITVPAERARWRSPSGPEARPARHG